METLADADDAGRALAHGRSANVEILAGRNRLAIDKQSQALAGTVIGGRQMRHQRRIVGGGNRQRNAAGHGDRNPNAATGRLVHKACLGIEIVPAPDHAEFVIGNQHAVGDFFHRPAEDRRPLPVGQKVHAGGQHCRFQRPRISDKGLAVEHL